VPITDSEERQRQIAFGEKLYRQGNVGGAAACFRLALAADPGSAQAHAQLAWCLTEPTKAHEAIEHLRIAMDLDPHSEKVLESLATLLVRAGDFDEASQIFTQALRLNPGSATALCGLVGCRKFGPNDRDLTERIASAAEEGGRTEKQRAHLHRAAGKAYDDLGEYETAMRHFDISNQISEQITLRQGKPFGAPQLEAYTNLLIDVFTPEPFIRYSMIGSNSELPVLVVGMIRSGTTLLDEILSRHPKVASAGEVNFWTGPAPGVMLKEFLRGKVDTAKANEVCQAYRILLRGAGPGKIRIIDKMPMNFLGLGLIHLLFPRARIIHCRRNPLDTCLSIYITELGTPRADFAVSRRNILFMYKQYLRLMEHWRSVLPPDCFLEVDYEAIVANQEFEIRRVIEFLGLDWDDTCLEVGKNSTIVTTPSAWQARQPIYSTSVERWRRYEPWLGEFRELLPESER